MAAARSSSFSMRPCNHLELLGGERDSSSSMPAAGASLMTESLGEVLHAAADVAGPLVHHGGGGGVHGDESQLVEPAGDVALPLSSTKPTASLVPMAILQTLFPFLQAHGSARADTSPSLATTMGNRQTPWRRGCRCPLTLASKSPLPTFRNRGGHHGAVVDIDTGGGTRRWRPRGAYGQRRTSWRPRCPGSDSRGSELVLGNHTTSSRRRAHRR